MTPISAAEAAFTPISTDEEIRQRVDDLVGRACVRQLWFFFLDDDDIQLPLIIPLADHPFDDLARGSQLESRSVVEVATTLVAFAALQMADIPAAKVVLVWERYQNATLAKQDGRWARQVAEAFHDAGLELRGQLLSYRRGVRWLAPEEYGMSATSDPATPLPHP
jgi:hypothetical protein